MTDTFIKAGNWFTAAATRIITKGAFNLDLFLKEKYLPGFNKPAIVGFNEDNKPIWACYVETDSNANLELGPNPAVSSSDVFIKNTFNMGTFKIIGGFASNPSINSNTYPSNAEPALPQLSSNGSVVFGSNEGVTRGLIYFTADLK